MSYRPEQRSIPVRILTSAGWLTGSLHLPAKSRLVEQLNRPTVFFRLTNVTLHGRNVQLPFLALHRHDMILVLPPATETDLHYVPETEPLSPHEVTCLLELGMVTGTIHTLRGVRTSDFVLNKQGFILVERATLRMGGLGGQAESIDREEKVIVNASCVLGVAEAAELGTLHDVE